MKAKNMEFSAQEMREMGEKAVAAVVDHIIRLPEASRSNLKGSKEIVRKLRESTPEKGTDFDSLLDFLMEKIIPVSINTPHPDYMAYIPGGGLYPSAVADYISSATNRFTGIWYAAPAAVRLETNVLEWFCDWMGFPAEARGILTSGGSLASFSAIVAARRHLLGDDLSQGVVYFTDQGHHCLPKAAILAGIPEKNLRFLETDDRFRLLPECLEKAANEDSARGLKPFLLVANAGTTNTGAVDPLSELGRTARRIGLWYHIDAAYGGFFNLCPEGKKRLSGLDEADSIVLDPHKGLFLPYGTGCLLVRNGELLRKAHMLTGDYMQDTSTPEGEVNPSDFSPELTRFSRGLRVWLPLKLYGIKTFRENLAEKLELTRWLYERFLEEPGFECVAEPDLSVIAFQYHPGRGSVDEFNRRLLRTINDSGRLFLSSTLLRNRFVIRVCILSFRTHREQVERAFRIITDTAKSLERGEI
jgi:aromatic-L-amino-acid decarboxylase